MVIRSLLKPKLWITLASLAFIAVALVHQGEQLRQINLESRGWWLLLLGLGLTWLSIMINGLAWRVLLDWLGQRPPRSAVDPGSPPPERGLHRWRVAAPAPVPPDARCPPAST